MDANLILIVWLHFIADFLLQPRQIAENKGKDIRVLITHCFIYGLCFVWLGWQYALLNAVLHLCIDFCSSRGINYFWGRGQKWAGFLVIGLDQALHYTCLFLTYWWLFQA